MAGDFAGWKRFVRRDDPTDAYLARKVGHGYELKRPGEELPSIRLPKEHFEAIYEPEEQQGTEHQAHRAGGGGPQAP